MVTQPKLDALNFQTSAVNIQLQIMNGLLSPATMGIDIAKKDNADAQREKEKVTIFTRNAILEKDGRMLLTKELDAAFDRKEYKTYFDWFMEKALLLKKIANQYNND